MDDLSGQFADFSPCYFGGIHHRKIGTFRPMNFQFAFVIANLAEFKLCLLKN